MTKLKSSQSQDNRPGHKKYVLDKRWLENKKRKVAKYNREVNKKRKKKMKRLLKESGIEKEDKEFLEQTFGDDKMDEKPEG